MTTAPSLAVAIYRYRSEWNAYLAESYTDDKTPLFYIPSLEVLENWHTPAENFNAATEALSLALDVHASGDAAVVASMIRAAQGFLERSQDASPALLSIIDDVETTHEAWVTSVPNGVDLPDASAEGDAFNDAEAAFLSMPCRSLYDVHAKAAWLLSPGRRSASTSVCHGIETKHLCILLRSFLGLSAERGE